jgi:hypothetical protein
MPLFSSNKNRELGVRSFLLKVVNNNCPELQMENKGRRLDSRVNIVIVVAIIPLKDGKLQMDDAFTAVTKEFSTNGLAVVLDRPCGLDKVVLAFRIDGELTFAKAEAKHLNPMGGGFFQLGFQLTDIVLTGDFPELNGLNFY